MRRCVESLVSHQAPGPVTRLASVASLGPVFAVRMHRAGRIYRREDSPRQDEAVLSALSGHFRCVLYQIGERFQQPVAYGLGRCLVKLLPGFSAELVVGICLAGMMVLPA